LFAKQHYLPDGKINLVENYDPDKGGPIVHYYWSNHYNHSSFNNLIITGLAGIRPSESDTLMINPLIDESIRYFCLEDVLYHGHKLTVLYDRDGSRYYLGKGLTVLVDGKKTDLIGLNERLFAIIGLPVPVQVAAQPNDIALNLDKKDYPVPSASINTVPDSLYQAIDGRIWYFPEISNRWTTLGSSAKTDWYALDFGKAFNISMIKIYPFSDENTFHVPDSITVEYQSSGQWKNVIIKEAHKWKPIANTVNVVSFDTVQTGAIRIHFAHHGKQVAISEIECY
jgi:hypothetical protein